MKNWSKIIAMVSILAMAWVALPGTADSGGAGQRAGTWEFFVPLTYTEEVDFSSENGSEVEINDDFGLGLGFGYNFNNHFQLNGTFNWSSRSYDATATSESGVIEAEYSNDLETFFMALNGVYYLMQGNFTPFISGTIGYTFLDTNIPEGPPEGYCWYDPWYGYICNDYTPTVTDEAFSYGGGLGLRLDFNRYFGMQGSYNRTWVDFDKADDEIDFDTWKLDFIFRMF
jgi:opacity protein-like surface antigen